MKRRTVLVGLAAPALRIHAADAPLPARPADAPLPVVASFSIVGDVVRAVGGERVRIEVLVGPGGDAHVHQPTPAQARQVAASRIVFSHGLGFEGWMPRLLRSTGFKGRHVAVADGVKTIAAAAAPPKVGHHHHHGPDPHTWQDVANVLVWVERIAAALCAADPPGCEGYRRRAEAYAQTLRALDAEIRAAWAAIPPAQRTVLTSHEAFGYYGAAYGVRFVAPQGVSTDAEASARGVATLIRQIRAEGVRALFVEAAADPRLVEQIGRETGLKPAGRLYADALSPPDGPASSYEALMRHNTRLMVQALR